MEKVKNVKIIYLIAVFVIIIGIVVTCIWKTNFSLLYRDHERIDVYVGKEYNLDDFKQIVKEVFPNEKPTYQEIEMFHDSIAIHVNQVSEEQLASFQEKVKEKYEIEEMESRIVTQTIPHYRIRDMVKPYVVPMLIITLIIVAYIGIRYFRLGVFKTIGILLLRLVVSEAVLASMIEILRIPVGISVIPVAILVYIFITILTVVGYENEVSRKKEQEKKKK